MNIVHYSLYYSLSFFKVKWSLRFLIFVEFLSQQISKKPTTVKVNVALKHRTILRKLATP